LCAAINRCPREVFGDAYDEALSASLGSAPEPSAGPSKQRLPAAPLLEAIETRRRGLEARFLPLFSEDKHDSALRRALERAREHGYVTLQAAELLCDEFGWHPYQLWGEAYEAAAFAGYPEDFDPWEVA
jgi:hypothetical protein